MKNINFESFVKNKNKVLGIVGLICGVLLAVVSSFYTVQFFRSMSQTSFAIFIVLVGVIIDLGKLFFPQVIPSVFKHNIGKKKWLSSCIYGTLAMICIIISLCASQAYDLNQGNRTINQAVSNDSSLKRSNDELGNLNKLTNDKQARLNQLNSEKYIQKEINDCISPIQQEVKTLENSRDTLSKNLADRQNYNEQILSKNNEISKNRIKIQKGIDSEKIKLKTEIQQNLKDIKVLNEKIDNTPNKINFELGIMAFAKWLSPKNYQNTAGIIIMIKNISVEVLAIGFFSAGFMFFEITNKDKKEEEKDNDNNGIFVSLEKPTNKIGFNTSSPAPYLEPVVKKQIGFVHDVDRKEIVSKQSSLSPEAKLYLKTLKSNIVNKVTKETISIKAVSSLLDIKLAKAKELHLELKKNNYIKCENKKTLLS